ncbi:MAG: VOC family protein [Pseudomonadales bacterium]
MTPKLNGIDHVHVYVNNNSEAERWYQTVLGFKRVDELMVWAVDNGPLTLANPQGNVHLALFERDEHPNTSAIAFGASGEEFLAWRTHLESHGLELRLSDHQLAWSLYFSDPYGNLHEITTYEHDYVAKQLG